MISKVFSNLDDLGFHMCFIYITFKKEIVQECDMSNNMTVKKEDALITDLEFSVPLIL